MEEKNKIIHLFVIEKCNHNCPLCCNKEYDIEKIDVVTVEELKNAHTVLLTGGEPFLVIGICDFAHALKKQYPNIKNVYIYTCGDALLDWLVYSGQRLHDIDGVNISPKNERDIECLRKILAYEPFREQLERLSSNRLYVFPETMCKMDPTFLISAQAVLGGFVKREWQANFVPSSDSVFRRVPVLLQ